MNEHIQHNHDETSPIESTDATEHEVEATETGNIDVEALKREWAAEWDKLLQVDIKELNIYIYRLEKKRFHRAGK